MQQPETFDRSKVVVILGRYAPNKNISRYIEDSDTARFIYCIACHCNVLLKSCKEVSCDIYPEDLKDLVLQEIKNRSLVDDAAIGQDNCNLSPAIIVSPATNEAYAKELRDYFIRLTKSFAPDSPPPSKEIGKGVYDYLIGVYDVYTNKEIAFGAKASNAHWITW